MKLTPKHIAYLLLFLFIAIVSEKVIPHSHIEKNGVVLPSLEKKSHGSQHEADSEELHNSLFQAWELNYSFETIGLVCLRFVFDESESAIQPIICGNYNILPKLLNSILFSIHTYSAKSPPAL